MRWTLALVGIVSSIGCSPPTTPTATPSPAILTVSGSVSDVVDRPVANVRIEVVGGPQQGTVTFSDAAGNFAIEPKLSSMSRIRASRQGYIDNTQLVAGTGPTIDLKFVLSSANAPLDWSGTYDVTITADATCTELPDLARRRTYAAGVTRGGNQRVVFSGATFGSFGEEDWNFMPFRQFDDYVELWSQDPPIMELLADNAYYMLYGGATGIVTRDFAQLNVYGGISYCPKRGVGSALACDGPVVTCVASGHQMTMTRK